jgi:hypothetical protein
VTAVAWASEAPAGTFDRKPVPAKVGSRSPHAAIADEAKTEESAIASKKVRTAERIFE